MINLRNWIIEHEGIRQRPYSDTVGKISIGVGRNLTDNGISLKEIDMLLDNDIDRCVDELVEFDWFLMQPEEVKKALINMCFNMGLPRLLGFKKMLAALEAYDYHKAASEALDSKWAIQVGRRAIDIADVIRAGK